MAGPKIFDGHKTAKTKENKITLFALKIELGHFLFGELPVSKRWSFTR